MKVTKMEAELFCSNCKKETIHEVIYIGDNIEGIVCSECDTLVEIDPSILLKNYKSELIERIVTKPHRMTEEIRSDLSKFLKTIPVRIITKPGRLVRELKEIEHFSHEEE